MRRMNLGKIPAKVFKQFRVEKNLTQLKMAELLGISWSSYLNIERGSIYNAKVDETFISLQK